MSNEGLKRPEAPAGIEFRAIRGEVDAEVLRAVHVGRQAQDGVDDLSTMEGVPTLEQVRAALAQAVVERKQDRWLVAQAGEQVAGYGRVSSWPEADGTWVYLSLGWVLPAWRGRGIGSAMLLWAEACSRHLAAAEHAGEKAELAANASSTEREATELLLQAGYRPAYHALEMGLEARGTVPPQPLPPGLEVRPARPEHYPQIAASVINAYLGEYPDGRYGEVVDVEAYAADLHALGEDPELWHVGWEGKQVAGQVMARVKDGRAEVFEVSVLPAWRRRGLARALLTRSLGQLQGRGIDVIRLHTVAEFRTRGVDLYQSVGFRVLKTFPRYRKPM
jgi:ribosomal protein S18 acetylase RimI-like enzyme